jgi:hypothetical protein
MPAFVDSLRTLVRSRHPIIWVVTWEEERALKAVQDIAAHPIPEKPDTPSRKVMLWERSTGTVEVHEDKRTVVDAEAVDPAIAVNAVMTDAKATGPGSIWVLRDLHRYLDTDPVYRFLRDAAVALRTSKTTIIVTAPSSAIPTELEKDVKIIDMPLPTAEELGVRLDNVIAPQVKEKVIPAPVNGERERILKAGLGLTEDEFAAAVCESMVVAHKVDPKLVVKAKEQIIRKSGILELYNLEAGFEVVGGLDLLKDWFRQKGNGLTDNARAFGCVPAKGCILMGPPGTGKSLGAKAAAFSWGVPLLRLSSSSILSKYVGESNQKLRRALQVADAVAPCILFIDEAEKFLAGAQSDAHDSGVARQLFGDLLSWMQDHTSPVITVATVNSMGGIPAEFMNRFSRTFLVDFPNFVEREEIFRIHLKKKGRDPKKFKVNELATATNGFNGREIERAIEEALDLAYDHKGELDMDWILDAVKAIKPLSVSRKAEIASMREWASIHATPASSALVVTQKQGGVDL